LWWALKLGSNNFGIVTAYTLNVFPIGPLWAGSQLFDFDDAPRVLENFPAYAEEANGNPEAAFTQVFFLFDGANYTFQLAMAFRTDEPEPPLWSTLTEGAEPLIDDMKVESIIDTLEGIRDNTRVRTMAYSRNIVADGTHSLPAVLKQLLLTG